MDATDENFLNGLALIINRFLDEAEIDENDQVIWNKIQKATIARVTDLKILLHSDDHTPYHFHVTSTQKSINARFEIATLKLLPGDVISSSDEKKIVHFLKVTNPAALVKMKEMSAVFYKKSN